MRCASHTCTASHQRGYSHGWWVSITLPYVGGWGRGVSGMMTNGPGSEPPFSWRAGSWQLLWPGRSSQMLRASVHWPDTHRYRMCTPHLIVHSAGCRSPRNRWGKGLCHPNHADWITKITICCCPRFKTLHCGRPHREREREWCVCELC